MKISILLENSVATPRPLGLVAEHGLSILIEREGKKILFDTGQTGKVVQNAVLLGVDWREVEAIILSHGHYDHTGGLRAVLENIGRPVKVYAHPDLFSPHYYLASEDKAFYIGIPHQQRLLESLGAKFLWVREAREIFPGLWVSGEVPRKTPFEKVERGMVLRTETGFVQDEIRDDLSVFIQTEQGLLILLGCAHAGPVNIIEHAREVTGESRILGLIGGTHLVTADQERLKKTLEYFRSLDLKILAPNHCTGFVLRSYLKDLFKESFRWGGGGEVFEVS